MSTAGTIPVAEALSLSGLITPTEGGIASCALAKTGGGNVMLLPSIRVRAPAGVKLLALDCHDDGTPGNAVTMVEVSDDPADVIPRMLGVNHHPEIVNRQRQLVLLEKKRARGGVNEHALHLTSSYTLMGPLRFALYRAIRLRSEAHGVDPGFHERDLPLVDGLDHAAMT